MSSAFKNFNTFIRFFKKEHSRESLKYSVLHSWEKIVGPAIAKHSQPYAFKGPTLYVMVAEPMWLSELKLNEKTLIDKIKRSFQIDLQTIHFKFGNIEKRESKEIETLSYRKQLEALELPETRLPELKVDQLFRETLLRFKRTWEKTQRLEPRKEKVAEFSTRKDRSQASNPSFLEFYYPKTGIRSDFLDFDTDDP